MIVWQPWLLVAELAIGVNLIIHLCHTSRGSLTLHLAFHQIHIRFSCLIPVQVPGVGFDSDLVTYVRVIIMTLLIV